MTLKIQFTIFQNKDYIQLVKDVIKEELVKYALPVYSQIF